MSQIHNTDLFNEIRDAGKIQTSRDILPSQLADKVVPVMEVNPKLLRYPNIVISSGTTATGVVTMVNTTSSAKDFYITHAYISITKDVVCDAATGSISISATINGAARTIVGCSIITLTAQDKTISLDFSHPLKIDRGTSITLTGTYTAGVMSRIATIAGYYVENPNA